MALDVGYGELHWRLRSDARVTVIERRTRARSSRDALPYRPGPRRGRRLVHLAAQGAAGACSRCARRALRLPGAGQAAVRGRPGAASARAAWCARPTTGARRSSAVGGGCAASSAARCSASPRRACRARRATARRSSGSASPGAPAPSATSSAPPRRWSREPAAARSRSSPTSTPSETGAAPCHRCSSRARDGGRRGARCRTTEVEKHRLEEGDGLRARRDPTARPTSRSCSAATARSSRRCARSPAAGAPVFAFNFGAIGFLSTVDHERARGRHRARARRATSRCSRCRRWRSSVDGERRIGVNDISFHRRASTPRGRARLLGRGRAARAGALRRPRGLHAGGLDGLQPRQRRPGAGLGRGGLRGVVHRAAHAHRARAGGRARRHADGAEPLRARRRWR